MNKSITRLLTALKIQDPSLTGKVKRNIFALFGLHGFNFLFTLWLVPLTLKCLTAYEYGIWLTLSSITTWFVSLDFGLGNGLRNKLAETLSINDTEQAKTYVSTTYFFLSIISIVFFLIFSIINPFIPWDKILNVKNLLNVNLNTVVFIVFGFFIFNFVFKLITFIISADQKPAINGFFTFVINLLTIALIYVLSVTPYTSLLNVGLIYSAIPSLVFLGASFFLFSRVYKNIKPSINYIKIKYSKDLIGLGFQFFILQIVSLIVYTTDNLIIAQLFDPSEVTYYNIAYKYFITISLVFGVILNPFWSAFTEAYVKGDFAWIKNMMVKLMKFWAIFAVIIVFMFLISGLVYKKWIGPEIEIPILLSLFMALFSILNMWNNIFSYFLNGVGKIRLQLYFAIFAGITNIPLSIILAKNLGLRSAGVILATCISLLFGTILAPVQYLKIIGNKSKGIWDK